MKLIYCPKCNAMCMLSIPLVFCPCKKSWGYYESDELHAVIGGSAIPLGIDNKSFALALVVSQDEPRGPDNDSSSGWIFEAFIIPEGCPTVRRQR